MAFGKTCTGQIGTRINGSRTSGLEQMNVMTNRLQKNGHQDN